jgi:hypothetical protein
MNPDIETGTDTLLCLLAKSSTMKTILI